MLSTYFGWEILGDKLYYRGYHVATFREDADRKELPPSVLIAAKEAFLKRMRTYE